MGFCVFRYIAPEQVPVQYGGLSKENDTDFCTADAVTEITIKPAGKHTVELPISEVGLLPPPFFAQCISFG